MESEQRENSNNVPKHLQPHMYKKGQSGNPNGRPKGSISLKQYAKKMLEQMTPEEREEYLEGLPKQFIWEMAEGKPDTKADVQADISMTVTWSDDDSDNDENSEDKDTV